MKRTFGLSWDHGKRKLAAAVALLLIAITLAISPATASLEARRGPDAGTTAEVRGNNFSVRGSTWG